MATQEQPARRAQGVLISAERESFHSHLGGLDRGRAGPEQPYITGDNTPTSDALDTIQENMAKEEALLPRAGAEEHRTMPSGERKGTGLQLCGE